MANDVPMIKRVLRDYTDAVSANDIRAWAKTLTNDIKFMAPDSPRAKGKKAVIAAVKAGFFDPFKINLKAKLDDVQVAGRRAAASGSFKMDLTPKSGGKKMKTAGKFVNFYAKRAGSWKFALVIFNYDKPPA